MRFFAAKIYWATAVTLAVPLFVCACVVDESLRYGKGEIENERMNFGMRFPWDGPTINEMVI